MSEELPKVSFIQYVAIVYNVVEAFFAILFGLLTRSIALTGFGLDSVAESIGDFVLVRRMQQLAGDPETTVVKLKQKPIVLVAILSFIFGSYILVQSIKAFLLKTVPIPSLLGMAIPILSLIFLPLLAFLSYRKSHSLEKAIILALRDIWAYMFLSLGLLIGLGLNYHYGFWQADPVVGLITVIFLYKKSLESILGPEDTSELAKIMNSLED
jgi:divalent metal cation (Fe/Co/Zn/Cd) transporter